MHTQGVCTPVSCITSAILNSTTTSARNPPYACRDEQLVFVCEVMNAVSLQWASEHDILCSNAISYTAGDNEGERRTRIENLYQSYLISVVRDPPNSNFTSNLTFTPSLSVNSVTVVCGDQLSLCRGTEVKHTVRITGKCYFEIEGRFSVTNLIKFFNLVSPFRLSKSQVHSILTPCTQVSDHVAWVRGYYQTNVGKGYGDVMVKLSLA